jgi:riboflavin biosynthesis pyrimidine reductase
MELHLSYTASEDTFPLPAHIRERYGPFGFPPIADSSRPYISSNFVMGLDARTSFREPKVPAGGREVSRSKTDRWLMDFLRAHHDAVLLGAATLREEAGPDGRGWDYAINDEELQRYRSDTLKLGRQKIIILSRSGDLDFHFRLFESPRVEPWILTGREGEKRLRSNLKAVARKGDIKIISLGASGQVDLAAAVRVLRQEHRIRTLLCEGGSEVYGALLEKTLIDEDFRTISLQVLGESSQPGTARPIAYGDVSYLPGTAPWFRLISLHYALPYHIFLRLRYEGPRQF